MTNNDFDAIEQQIAELKNYGFYATDSTESGAIANTMTKLFNEVKTLRRRNQQLEAVARDASWLAGEVERDHELGRLSVDSEGAAKAVRKALTELKEVEALSER